MKSSSLFTVFLAAGAYAMPTTAEAEDAGLEKRTGPGIVAAAEKMKGKPYVWGGGDIHGPTNGGFDCSGLTQYSVYQAQKTEIPRTAQTQYTSKLGKHIPRAQAKAGDLLFWGRGGQLQDWRRPCRHLYQARLDGQCRSHRRSRSRPEDLDFVWWREHLP